MKQIALACVWAWFVLVLAVAVSSAALVEFTGYSYETGAFPPSNPGDALQMVSIIDLVAAPLSWSPTANQYTLTVSGLVSQGQVPLDVFNILVPYTGGTIFIYEDATGSGTPAIPEINPPNATVPSSYTDGVEFLVGALQTFQVTYNTNFEAGAFEGEALILGGAHADELGIDTDVFTFGGVFRLGTPEGYDLSWDGFILLDGVPVENKTWGGIKSLYRNTSTE